MMKKRKLGEENRSQLQSVSFSDNAQTISSLKKNQTDSYDELESYKRLRKRRIKIACYRMAIWLVVILFIPIFVFLSIVITNPSSAHNFFGYTMYVVVSDSMTPEIGVNDCIVIKKVTSQSELSIGDDITFIRQSDGQTITHRIIDIIEDNGELKYVTKGIHVPTADSGLVSFENVIGKRVLTLGAIGQIIMFFRQWYGLLTFIAIFVSIMILFVISFRVSDDIRAVGR